MAQPQSTLPNDEKEAQDSAYNPGEQAYREGVGAGYAKSGTDQAEAFVNDPNNHDSSKNVRDAEANPDESLTRGLYKPSQGGRKQKFSLKNFAKRKGPVGIIAGVVLGGGGLAAILASPSLLFFQIQDSLVNRFDSQNTSMTIRTNKVITSKIEAKTTQGLCSDIKIACRFSKPSNSFLKNMEKNGVRALDAGGAEINKTKGPFPNARPAKYIFTPSSGPSITVDAKNFSETLRTNTEFRAAFHRTYNPRFSAFSDSVFRSIQKRFGFKKTNTLADAKSEEDVKKAVNEGSKGRDTGLKTALAEGGDEAAESVLTKLIKAQATQSLNILKKSGKGGVVSLATGGVCIATNIPGAAISVTRAYQMAQLVLYSSKFLTTASAMKTGDSSLSSVVVSALGSSLTQTKDGSSAMDSFGMKYGLFGDTKAKSTSYTKFSPGASAIGALGGLNQITSSQATRDSCSVALNPVTSAAINGALVAAGGATFGVTAGAALLNLGIGVGVSKILEAAIPALSQFIADGLKPYYKELLGLVLGDLTANLLGADVGDALASGSAHMMGQTANAGGNMPLTVDQAVAYNSATKDVQLAYAQEDRATLSPLDATNKNTFLGSIVSGFLPYYSQLGTMSGALKTIGSIPSMSLGSLLQPSKASAVSVAAQYELCDDPAIKGALNGPVAAGPFCNIEYGIPTQYLNMDPQQVVDALVASGDINEDTGEPVDLSNDGEAGTTSLKGWMELCTDGTTDQAANCKIADEKTALYAIYTIDHRIQRTMDDMDEVASVQKSSSATGAIVSPVIAGFRLTSTFGPRVKPCATCSSYHKGLDFVGADQIVHSTMDGTVISVGGDQNNTVRIRHADGLVSEYLHMRLSDIKVKAGDTVTANQVIGKMGNEGQSTGTHLHFQLKITGVKDPSIYAGYTQNSGFIDPSQFFAKNGVGGFS